MFFLCLIVYFTQVLCVTSSVVNTFKEIHVNEYDEHVNIHEGDIGLTWTSNVQYIAIMESSSVVSIFGVLDLNNPVFQVTPFSEGYGISGISIDPSDTYLAISCDSCMEIKIYLLEAPSLWGVISIPSGMNRHVRFTSQSTVEEPIVGIEVDGKDRMYNLKNKNI